MSKSSGRSATSIIMPAVPRAASVLFVEDDDVVRTFVAEILRGSGFEVTAVPLAESAEETLQTMRPDVIVLDLGMPVGSLQGIEFLARLREREAEPHIPVVIMSGLGDAVNRDVTARLDVAAVVSKPLVNPDQLVRVIHEALGG